MNLCSVFHVSCCYAGSWRSNGRRIWNSFCHYLGHFLLTRLLLDSLVHSGKDGSCSRVVSISSSAHFAADARLQDLLSMCGKTQHTSAVEINDPKPGIIWRSRAQRCWNKPQIRSIRPGARGRGMFCHTCDRISYILEICLHKSCSWILLQHKRPVPPSDLKPIKHLHPQKPSV